VEREKKMGLFELDEPKGKTLRRKTPALWWGKTGPSRGLRKKKRPES